MVARKNLVVVESPAKAKTLEKFLGKDYRVLASYGHVRDLPRKGLGVDRDNAYEPTYEVVPGKEKTLGDLKKAAREASAVFLAADPDREGEAISWHLQEALRSSGKNAVFKRVRFNEITKKAVLRAMEDAGEIDARLVDAQQARRIIDRLVGYEVSDLLWKKIWRGLSAGRVQTVALRIICDREREIEAFKAVEYWTVDGELQSSAPPPFTARLFAFDGQKLKFDGTDPRLPDGEAAERVRENVAGAVWKVSRVETSERRKNPAPPFITSQLQQAAARRLSFAVRRTMQIAQRLYEGREIPGRGTVGLITYMRTDSTRVSEEALAGVRDLIRSRYGPEALPEAPRYFKSKRGDSGRARGDPADVSRPASRDGRAEPFARGSEALPADLGALRRLADGPRRLRRDLGRHRGGPRALPRLGLDLEVSRVSRGLRRFQPKRRKSRTRRRARPAACRRSRRARR